MGIGTGDTSDEELEAAMIVLGDALRRVVVQRPEVGEALVLLATALRGDAPLKPASVPPEEPEEPEEDVGLGAEAAVQAIPEGLDSLPADPEPQSLASIAPWEPAEDWRQVRVDLELVEKRAGLKARALAWALRRREILKGEYEFNEEVKPTDNRLVNEAKELGDCFLWMVLPDGPQEGLEQLELTELATCYRAVEMAAGLARCWESDHDLIPNEQARTDLLKLAAEAQSSLRTGLVPSRVGRDEDQHALYIWVRQWTDRYRVFLDCHMSRESCASPQGLEDFPERLGALRERAEQKLERDKSRQNSINRIEYHVKILEEQLAGGANPGDEPLIHHWRKVLDTASSWVQDGNQTTDERLLACMARIADEVPAELDTGHVTTILRAVGRWRDSRAEVAEEELASGELDTGAQEGPSDVPEAIARVLQCHADQLVLALNNRSDRDYPYSRPREVFLALEWLATTLWPLKAGQTTGLDHRKLNHQLLELCGWSYRSRQSATTMGSFRDWYQCTHDGRVQILEEHIGRGNAKRQGPNSIRVAFSWDAPSKKIVIGFLGQHQKTGDT